MQPTAINYVIICHSKYTTNQKNYTATVLCVEVFEHYIHVTKYKQTLLLLAVHPVSTFKRLKICKLLHFDGSLPLQVSIETLQHEMQ